ncbi:MAG: hypothetical protein LBT46_05475 [Planctomycetaceae bacterium]|jgi:hypothetical protein|nr:hypothetical protein [Planctomycetaceae bacterium]
MKLSLKLPALELRTLKSLVLALCLLGTCTIVKCPLSVVNASSPLKALQPIRQQPPNKPAQNQTVPHKPEPQPLTFPDAEEVLPDTAPVTVRGQVTTAFNELDEILKTPPPHAQGPVDSAAVEPKLIEQSAADIPILNAETAAALLPSAEASLKPAAETKSDQFAYGTLLIATAVTTIGLIYMAFVAYDYRQRWMQSLMTQNDRFTGNPLDGEWEDIYGTPHYV